MQPKQPGPSGKPMKPKLSSAQSTSTFANWPFVENFGLARLLNLFSFACFSFLESKKWSSLPVFHQYPLRGYWRNTGSKRHFLNFKRITTYAKINLAAILLQNPENIESLYERRSSLRCENSLNWAERAQSSRISTRWKSPTGHTCTIWSFGIVRRGSHVRYDPLE